MKKKIAPYILASIFLFACSGAKTVMSADKIDKMDRDIAKDRDKVASKKAEITAAQDKLNKDMNQYGSDSSQAGDDRKSLTELRNDLVNIRADLYKSVNKRKVAEGQPIEEEPV